MPNRITCTLTVDKDFNLIKEFCTTERSQFDFQKILQCPYPDDHPITVGSDEDISEEDWYHWRIKHWGTKWHAWDVTVLENGFTFITAWDPPWGIIGELMRQFPEVTFTLSASDEPCNGYWTVVACNGQIISGNQDRQESCPRCRDENNGVCQREEPVEGAT